jgi:hypothetical protein
MAKRAVLIGIDRYRIPRVDLRSGLNAAVEQMPHAAL